MENELNCFVCSNCSSDLTEYPQAPFGLIWAITRQCNLRCTYCFPEVHSQCNQAQDLSRDDLLKIANNIMSKGLGVVTLSGGEIFLKKEIFEIADLFLKNGTSVTLMSNGTMINDQIAQEISERIKDGSKLRIALSLDHHEEDINKIMRGTGGVAKVFNSIELLLKYGVSPSIATVVNKTNIKELDSFVHFLHKEKSIKEFALQHLGHFGTPVIFDIHRPNIKDEWSLRREKIPQWQKEYPELEIQYGEFWLYDYERMKPKDRTIMGCRSGIDFAYVDFDGNAFPCTSASDKEFLIGNLLENDLPYLWKNSDRLKRYRQFLQTPVKKLPECTECDLNDRCWAGCRGEALFYSGSILGRPARCPKRRESSTCV